MPSISFRLVRADEAPLLSKLAIASKKSWGYSDELMALWTPTLTLTSKDIETRIVLVGEIDSNAIAFSVLEETCDGVDLDGFWVHPSAMGVGVGKRLLQRTLKQAYQSGYESVTIVSDPHAEGFYIRCGAVRTGSYESKPAGRILPVLELKTFAINDEELRQ